MLNPQIAEARLKEFSTDKPQEKQRDRASGLPEASRVAAYALLGLKPDGTPYVTINDYSQWDKRRKQQEQEEKAKSKAHVHLNGLPPDAQEKFFAVFFPRLAPHLLALWHGGSGLYMVGYARRPFRLAKGTVTPEVQSFRQNIFNALISQVSAYQEMPLDWFAAWMPYLGAYMADNFGKLFAAAIDAGGPEGDAVFDVLMASGRGDHEVGAMGRHVPRGLLSASRPEGWEFVEKLLLAAQRQEGLRQSILEVVDEAHPEAFRRMLKLIRENDLFRFSATIRAADVWFGMNWVAYEKLSVKQANAATQVVETFLADPQGRDEVLATTEDGQTVYLALWSAAFEDAHHAFRLAVPMLSDPRIARRYAALHLLTELRLEETKIALLSALDDADLRVAQKAFAASNWYENSANAGSQEAFAALLTEQEADLTEELETSVEPNTPLSNFLSEIKNVMGELLGAVKTSVAENAAENVQEAAVPTVVQDDRFECLERNIPRFPAKPKELEPVIWEWDKLTAHAETLADALPRVIGNRPIDRLVPFVPLMGSYGRAQVANVIAGQKNKTPEMREVLLTLVGDSASYVRDAAYKAVEKFDLAPEEVERVEGLLTRKANDLRKSALHLLFKRDDASVIQSGERLTGAKDASQRVAGLDLMTQMVEKKRSPEKARAVVATFVAARADKLTSAEKAMLEPLTNEAHEKPTLDNALGLMDPAKLTPVVTPVLPRDVPLLTSAASAKILVALYDLVEKNKEEPVASQNYNGDTDEVLLGNAGWRFPNPNWKKPAHEDLERFPLREIFEGFWNNRTKEMRDEDGMELERARFLISEPGFIHAYLHLPGAPDWVKKQFRETEKVEKGDANNRDRQSVISSLISWLRRLDEGAERNAKNADYFLRAAEASLSVLAQAAPPVGEKDRRNDTRFTIWFNAARHSYTQQNEAWTPEMEKRMLSLILWFEQAQKPVQHILTVDEMAAAFRAGVIIENDVYHHLLSPYSKSYNTFTNLKSVSSRKNLPVFDTTPGFAAIAQKCRERIVEVELRRGDTETAASQPARELRYSGGMETLLKLVSALGKDTFARGYSYYGTYNRSNVFSQLIRVTFPGEEETPEVFAKAAKASGIAEKRLIETAMYAPQWTKHVEATLGWKGFTEAVWWLHAHTKDNSWSVEAEIKEAWTAEIGDKTPLTGADLTEGAVDVAWFKRVHEALGAERWLQVDEAAKYASSAGGHKRAQLFAGAMLGRENEKEIGARIRDKRHQDAVRALGLLPLPKKETKAFEAELLSRYKIMQEFLRTTKQFGAQRQESEKLAVRIGMENLARTAGYPDPIRLTWAMEASAVADLKEGAITKTVGEVEVTLSINGLGLPNLAVVKKNKVLANIPPAVKKDPDVAELVARKTDITRQVSRMRESLEGAMCRGDRFTGAELEGLLDHPILKPLLQNLIFIEDEGKEQVIGYPLGGNRLEDYNGVDYGISAGTPLRIAHPYDLLHTGNWQHWQKDCFLRERIQPFKQVFRELYVLTPAETADGTKSQRYSGHQVNPKQALALFNKRGWVGGGDYDYDSNGPRKTYHEDGFTVSVGFMGWTAGPADVEGSTVEEVRFTKKGDWKPVALESVPPRVFSEAMRDLDLVVSVAHVGGVDPEASQSTVEMREALVREAMGLLKIENVRFQKSHAIVDGALATYNVHLGSAIVHRQPGGYLCIVPVHSQHRGRLFLPFVDDDPRTAEVVSKVLLLARDSEIKDPTILEQILAVR